MITKQNWINAGSAIESIDINELQQTLGVEIPDSACDWKDVCAWVYKHIAGFPIPHCTKRGQGSRSRYFGEQVASVWKEPTQ